MASASQPPDSMSPLSLEAMMGLIEACRVSGLLGFLLYTPAPKKGLKRWSVRATEELGNLPLEVSADARLPQDFRERRTRIYDVRNKISYVVHFVARIDSSMTLMEALFLANHSVMADYRDYMKSKEGCKPNEAFQWVIRHYRAEAFYGGFDYPRGNKYTCLADSNWEESQALLQMQTDRLAATHISQPVAGSSGRASDVRELEAVSQPDRASTPVPSTSASFLSSASSTRRILFGGERASDSQSLSAPLSPSILAKSAAGGTSGGEGGGTRRSPRLKKGAKAGRASNVQETLPEGQPAAAGGSGASGGEPPKKPPGAEKASNVYEDPEDDDDDDDADVEEEGVDDDDDDDDDDIHDDDEEDHETAEAQAHTAASSKANKARPAASDLASPPAKKARTGKKAANASASALSTPDYKGKVDRDFLCNPAEECNCNSKSQLTLFRDLSSLGPEHHMQQLQEGYKDKMLHVKFDSLVKVVKAMAAQQTTMMQLLKENIDYSKASAGQKTVADAFHNDKLLLGVPWEDMRYLEEVEGDEEKQNALLAVMKAVGGRVRHAMRDISQALFVEQLRDRTYVVAPKGHHTKTGYYLYGVRYSVLPDFFLQMVKNHLETTFSLNETDARKKVLNYFNMRRKFSTHEDEEVFLRAENRISPLYQLVWTNTKAGPLGLNVIDEEAPFDGSSDAKKAFIDRWRAKVGEAFERLTRQQRNAFKELQEFDA